MNRTVDVLHSFELSGYMHFAPVEGGCWQFISDSGERYEITGKKVFSLLKEGRRAELLVRGPLQVASICQVGQVVELIEIIKTTTD